MRDILEDYLQNYRICCLFRAVLELAAKDAFFNRGRSKKKLRLKYEALDFFANDKDLKLICQMAGAEYTDILAICKDNSLKNKEKYKKIIIHLGAAENKYIS